MDEHKPEWPAGIKKTKQRLLVYSILEGSASPMSAMDIYKQIENGDSAFWLSTVYRVLELFVKEGLAVKTTVMNDSMALYTLKCERHMHYAICVSCHKVIEMENCPLEKFMPQLADSEFHVLGHKVEMYGYCKECDQKACARSIIAAKK